MTCFWDSLRKGLGVKSNNHVFINYLKKKNKMVSDVIWNNKNITRKQADENFTHIKDFNINKIHNGYDCSIFDPFLILITYLFEVDIDHNYNGNVMKYRKFNNKSKITFHSDHGHFSFGYIKKYEKKVKLLFVFS
jgi:hypothetical protein